ncbi:melanocortin receptor 1-like [Arapaima gigas]
MSSITNCPAHSGEESLRRRLTNSSNRKVHTPGTKGRVSGEGAPVGGENPPWGGSNTDSRFQGPRRIRVLNVKPGEVGGGGGSTWSPFLLFQGAKRRLEETKSESGGFSSMGALENGANASAARANQSACAQLVVPHEVFLSLGCVSLVENVLVVWAIARNRNLHSPMFYFICCLAVSDMLVSASNALETLVMLLSERALLAFRPRLVQHLDDAVDTVICGALLSSLSFLCAIAADRYVTVFHALRYHSIVTAQRAAAAIAAIWTASAASSVLFVLHHTAAAVVACLVAFFCVTLALTAALYLRMFVLAARVRSRRVAEPRERRRRAKGAVTVIVLLGAFVACWGPFFLHLVLMLACPEVPRCGCFFAHFHLFLVLILLNSVIDPLIYAFRSRELRRTIRELVLPRACSR